MLQYMRAASSRHEEAVRVINSIITCINNSGNRKPGAILYLGDRQYFALKTIEAGDKQEVKDEEFDGWPIVQVRRESWCRLSS